MEFTVQNWLVLTINSDAERVLRGVDVEKCFCSSYEEAYDYMVKKAEGYKKATEIDIQKKSAYIQTADYFVQIEIIDCSSRVALYQRKENAKK